MTTDEHIEAVKKMILVNCRITIGEVADDMQGHLTMCKEV